jgi:hypothetical protein
MMVNNEHDINYCVSSERIELFIEDQPFSSYELAPPLLPSVSKLSIPLSVPALQRQNTEILKQIFPEKEYRGLSPNFHIHASLRDLYISTMGLPILLEDICRPILGLYKSLTDT